MYVFVYFFSYIFIHLEIKLLIKKRVRWSLGPKSIFLPKQQFAPTTAICKAWAKELYKPLLLALHPLRYEVVLASANDQIDHNIHA